MYDMAIGGDDTTDLPVQEPKIAGPNSIKAMAGTQRAQRINALRAAGLQICLLTNFAPEDQACSRRPLKRSPYRRSSAFIGG